MKYKLIYKLGLSLMEGPFPSRWWNNIGWFNGTFNSNNSSCPGAYYDCVPQLFVGLINIRVQGSFSRGHARGGVFCHTCSFAKRKYMKIIWLWKFYKKKPFRVRVIFILNFYYYYTTVFKLPTFFFLLTKIWFTMSDYLILCHV